MPWADGTECSPGKVGKVAGARNKSSKSVLFKFFMSKDKKHVKHLSTTQDRHICIHYITFKYPYGSVYTLTTFLNFDVTTFPVSRGKYGLWTHGKL